MATEKGTKGVQLAAETGEAIARLAGVIDESAQVGLQRVAGGQPQASDVEWKSYLPESSSDAPASDLPSV